jgi:hypothetical protein
VNRTDSKAQNVCVATADEPWANDYDAEVNEFKRDQPIPQASSMLLQVQDAIGSDLDLEGQLLTDDISRSIHFSFRADLLFRGLFLCFTVIYVELAQKAPTLHSCQPRSKWTWNVKRRPIPLPPVSKTPR